MTRDTSSSAPAGARRARHAALYRGRGDWPDTDLFSALSATCAARGAAVAVADGIRDLSFRDWVQDSEKLAERLAERGVGRGDVVAYQLPNWWEAAVVFLATARVGAVVNPILPIFRAHELRFILAQSRAAVLFLPARYRQVDYVDLVSQVRADLPDLTHPVVVRGSAPAGFESWDELIDGAPTRGPIEAQPIDREDLLLLMYTSGTTAEPKGVLHTHATLISEVKSLERVHGLGHRDTTLMPSPLTHISGVLHGILVPAILGTRAVLMERWDPETALSLIERQRVTYMVGAPTFLRDLTEGAGSTRHDLSSLRLFSSGGANVSAELVRSARAALGCVAKRVYGSTEFPTLTTTDARDAASMGTETEGRPIAPAEVRITAADGTIVPVGEEGEVQARGPECFVGYLDRALDAEAFSSDGWFRTGDLGRLDDDGYLRITGRLKEIIIRKGEKISVRELEELIGRHPSVAAVCVIAVPDDTTGERACAAVVARPGAAPQLEDLTRFLRGQGLAPQKLPEELVVLPELPYTDSGKVHRAALRQRLIGKRGTGRK